MEYKTMIRSKIAQNNETQKILQELKERPTTVRCSFCPNGARDTTNGFIVCDDMRCWDQAKELGNKYASQAVAASQLTPQVKLVIAVLQSWQQDAWFNPPMSEKHQEIQELIHLLNQSAR
jgi:hypothetical protein